MECIGQSFALKIEESKIIAASLKLYEQWLGLEPGCEKRLSTRMYA